jgi:hypothetical protein
MKRALRLLLLAVVTVGVMAWYPAAAQGGTFRFENALAFVGSEGNVYLADLNTRRAIPLTGDSTRLSLPNAPFFQLTRQYGQFRWSPDGSRLLFVERTTGAVYVAASGQQPVQIATTSSENGYPPVWSPDGAEIAYAGAGAAQNTVQLQAVPLSTAGGAPQPHPVGSFVDSPCVTFSTSDPAQRLYWNEIASPTLIWTANGFIRHAACSGDLGLFNASGGAIWEVHNLSRVALSPDGTHLAAIQVNPATRQALLVIINLATGALNTVQTLPASDQIAWMPDGSQILYSSLEPFPADAGNAQRPVGHSLFPGAWPLLYSNYFVRLLSIPVTGGAPTELFGREGMGIGQIAVVPDGSGVAFSFVTSSVSMVRRINLGTSPNEALTVAPDVQLWYRSLITGTQAVYIASGRQLAWDKGSFTAAAAATPLILDPAAQLVVGRPALVMTKPGDGLNLRALPGLAALVLRPLQSAEVLDVVGGPQFVDGNRWWQLHTYEGLTGWAIDSASAGNLISVNLRPLASEINMTFSADRTTIQMGECITLAWYVHGALSATLNNRPVALSGSETECPSSRSPYILFAFGSDGAWASGFNVDVLKGNIIG